MNFKKEIGVSVIVPVYNARKFLEEAVESAIHLPQVKEVVLVEDGSRDQSLEVCLELEKKYAKIYLYRHPGGENHGAAASRNLGIRKSLCPYVAFLDADDWYLPSRFEKEQAIFSSDANVDAVYSYPILEKDLKDHSKEFPKEDLRENFGQHLDQKDFYRFFIEKSYPFFHTNTVTIKKEFLSREKAFDERLRLHQDSELWLRLLRRGNVFAGELAGPVAVIRRHNKNRITSRSVQSRLQMLAAFIENVGGVRNLLVFEKKNLVRNALRLQSQVINNNWKRRFYFYSRLVPATFFKDNFLQRMAKNAWEKPQDYP